MNLRWGRRKYTKEEFIEAWNSSTSISQVAHKLNANRSGSGFYTLRASVIALGLTQDHMNGSRTSRFAASRTIPLEDILNNMKPYASTSRLKQRLYEAGLLIRECASCRITEWNGLPAPLALDHIDGNRSNNLIDNLRVLCYNCHGQTETFGSKNKVRKI